MNQEGILGKESKGRAKIGAHLYNTYNADFIITLGCDYRKDSTKNISDAMKDYIVSTFHIEDRSIISESRSRDTVGDAVYTAFVIDELKLDVSTIYIVTSDYHQERAHSIFSFILGPKYTILSPLALKTNPLLNWIGCKQSHEENSMKAFEKTFAQVQQGDLANIFSTLTSKHPYYNGEILCHIEKN